MNDIKKQLLSVFPVLADIHPDILDQLIAVGTIIRQPKGAYMVFQNQSCIFIPLVLSGSLRIYKQSPTGREMTIFRTGPGEVCLMSIACHLRGIPFPATAQVDEDIVLFGVPYMQYDRLLASSSLWKDYLILTLYERLVDAMGLIDTVTFTRVDMRLCEWLTDQCYGKHVTIYATHEQIAVELGSAREVVSRLLGDLKAAGVVALGRGKIEVLRPDLLPCGANRD